MKKKITGLCVGIMASVSMTVVALAISPTWYTSLSANKTSIMGVTSLATANYCSSHVTGYYSGGSKSDFSEGISGATATVHVSESTPMYSGHTNHRIEVGSAVYTNTTGA